MASTTTQRGAKTKTSAKTAPKRTKKPKSPAKSKRTSKAAPKAKGKTKTKAPAKGKSKTKTKKKPSQLPPKDTGPSPLLALPAFLWTHSNTILIALTLGVLSVAAFDVTTAVHTPAVPTLLHRDLVLVDQLTTAFSSPQPGDAVLVRQRSSTTTPTHTTMARLLALGGSNYTWDRRTLLIDGTPLEHTPPPAPPTNLSHLPTSHSLAFAPVLPEDGAVAIGSALSDSPPPLPKPTPAPITHTQHTVPRHHALVLLQPPPSRADPSPPLQAIVVPQGDIRGVGRIVLSHLGASKRWQDFIPHPLR